MEEVWKVYTYPETGKKYYVSNTGLVKSLDNDGKVYVHSTYKNNGYRCIPTTKKNGKNTLIYLHKVIAELFIDNPNHYQRLHFIDENPANCRVDNIKWISPEEYREINRKRTKPYDIYPGYAPNAKLTRAKVAIIKKKALQNEVDQKTRWTVMARQFGINIRHLYMIRKGKIWPDVEPAK